MQIMHIYTATNKFTPKTTNTNYSLYYNMAGGFFRRFSTFLIVLMLLMAAEKVAEARTCESKSHRFKGACVSRTNCASVCITEGFHGGRCRGFRRRCFCTKHC
ncbi:defensin J1-2-like [Primulina eburnea]|uniref:defensin J1-2-like n=1 Tax=Primulina eburnea TaxID=1245227 RepID=UPI003C6C2ECA